MNSLQASKASGLVGRAIWHERSHFYQQNFGLKATVEVIYGHAWQTEVSAADAKGEVRIPVAQIGKKQ